MSFLGPYRFYAPTALSSPISLSGTRHQSGQYRGSEPTRGINSANTDQLVYRRLIANKDSLRKIEANKRGLKKRLYCNRGRPVTEKYSPFGDSLTYLM
jgi:hypothetical protein